MENLNHKSALPSLSSLPSILMPLRFARIFSLILISPLLLSGASYSAASSVTTKEPPHQSGTTIFKKNQAFHGYSLYTSYTPGCIVNLINMDGTVVHRWTGNQKDRPFMCMYATPFPDGSILLSCEPGVPGWQWIDANSHTIATYNISGQHTHHGTYRLQGGGFLGLVAKPINMPFLDKTLRIVDDSLVRLSAKGDIIKEIPLSKLLSKDPGYQKALETLYKKLKTRMPQRPAQVHDFDPTHATAIENLEEAIPGVAKKGDWLVTLRNLNRIIIVNPDKEEIVWQWGDNILSGPHGATFIKGNKILLFDNGRNRKYSQIIIVDIKSKAIVWQYGQKPGQEFHSLPGGFVQQLPNDNILIAETDSGRAFEVTPSKEIVWEFYTQPGRKNKRKHKPIRIIKRIPYGFFKGIKFNYGILPPQRNK